MYVMLDHWSSRLVGFVAGILLALPWLNMGALAQGAKLGLSSTLLTYAVMPLVIRLAIHMDAVDRPEARRVHQSPTPRIGGLAVIFSVNVTLLLNFSYSDELKAVCVSALLVALVSMWDDVRGLSASFKLLMQFFAVLILILSGVSPDFGNYNWLIAYVGPLWALLLHNGLDMVLTALWIIGITNAFNFLDGINGLAVALAATICLLMGLLAATTAQTYMLLLCVTVAGASLGFLPDNGRYKRPARIFLGDTGSTYIGWMMASIALMGNWSSKGFVQAYAAPILIFSVPIFDMIYTTVARIVRGEVHNMREWIAYVGRDHLHHRLMALDISQAHAVLAIVVLSLISGLAALVIIDVDLLQAWVLLTQAIVVYAVFSFVMLRAAQKLERDD